MQRYGKFFKRINGQTALLQMVLGTGNAMSVSQFWPILSGMQYLRWRVSYQIWFNLRICGHSDCMCPSMRCSVRFCHVHMHQHVSSLFVQKAVSLSPRFHGWKDYDRGADLWKTAKLPRHSRLQLWGHPHVAAHGRQSRTRQLRDCERGACGLGLFHGAGASSVNAGARHSGFKLGFLERSH